jgi:hypothetical protein
LKSIDIKGRPLSLFREGPSIFSCDLSGVIYCSYSSSDYLRRIKNLHTITPTTTNPPSTIRIITQIDMPPSSSGTGVGVTVGVGLGVAVGVGVGVGVGLAVTVGVGVGVDVGVTVGVDVGVTVGVGVGVGVGTSTTPNRVK